MTIPIAMVTRLKSLPAMSVVVAKLYSVINSEHNSASDVEAVIKLDPSLTANLLRIANSPYFGLRREVSSVTQAVNLLGRKRLYELATGAALSNILPKRLPVYEVDARMLWRHCAATAVLAEKLAEEAGFGKSEFVFTAGLLHDVGKLAIGAFFSDRSEEYRHLIQSRPISSIEAEREMLGLDHCEVGGQLAELWNLPEPIVVAAQRHHEPGKGRNEEEIKFLALIHTADALCHAMGYGEDAGEMARKLDSEAIEKLGFKVRRMEEAASETADAIRDLCEQFDETAKEVQ